MMGGDYTLEKKLNVVCRPRQRSINRHLLKRLALMGTNDTLMPASVFIFSRLQKQSLLTGIVASGMSCIGFSAVFILQTSHQMFCDFCSANCVT
jgi:hypothetical protein